MVFLRSQFGDFFLSTMLPNLRFIVENQFKEKPDQISQVFRRVGINDLEGGHFNTSQVAGVELLVETGEGQTLQYSELVQRFDKNHQPLKYALGFKITEEAISDGKFKFLEAGLRSLARAAHQVKQVNAFNVLNRAFNASYTGPDAKELCAADHPSLAGNQANELATAADLNFTSLSLAIRDMMDSKDDRGMNIEIKPDRLIVPNELVHDARELLASTDRPDTADRAINALRDDNLKLIVNAYLTDADAWFLAMPPTDPDYHIYFIEREDYNTDQIADFDTDVVKVKGKMKHTTGWGDWRGIFGSPGA